MGPTLTGASPRDVSQVEASIAVREVKLWGRLAPEENRRAVAGTYEDWGDGRAVRG